MNLVYPLAHLLGGAMLLSTFSMLSQRRLFAMISLYRIEAITFTSATFWQAYAQGRRVCILLA